MTPTARERAEEYGLKCGDEAGAAVCGKCARGFLAGYAAAIEDAARVITEQRRGYFNQMEGAGDPDFSMLDFAHAGCGVLLAAIRSLASSELAQTSEEKAGGG